MDHNHSAVPIVEMLLTSVDLPDYPIRRKPNESLTAEGSRRKKTHENSRSVKNVAPIHYIVRGDPRDIQEFGKSTACEQLSMGNFHSANHSQNMSRSLAKFQPAEKDNTLMHGVETAVVLSGYLHVIYNTTRLTESTHILNNGRSYSMQNIITLPEDTIGFEAKLRKDRTLTNGTLRRAGERDTFCLRCDLKIAINLPTDRNQPMSGQNMRQQVILPLEYKREGTFSLEDIESSMEDMDSVPAFNRRRSPLGHPEGRQPFNPPPRQGAGMEIPIDMDQDAEMFDGQDHELDEITLQGLGLGGVNVNLPWNRGTNQRASPDVVGWNRNAAVAAGMRQMSAYSASERNPYATLMTGDMQLFAEFPEMVLQKTAGEQWDLGVGDYAILYVVPKSGDWIAGMYGVLVWTWMMFMFVVQ